MAKQPTCLVCQKEMELGFLTDLGHLNAIHMPRWCAGEPKASFMSGEAKSSQRKSGLKVVAYRCPECEALRLYAPAGDQCVKCGYSLQGVDAKICPECGAPVRPGAR